MSDGEEKYMNKEYGIELRPIDENDSELVVKWRNSTQVKQFFIYQKDISIEEQHRWIDTKVKTGKVIQFIIVEKATNKPIGSVYFRDIDYDMHKAEYGIFIGEASGAIMTLTCLFLEKRLSKNHLEVSGSRPSLLTRDIIIVKSTSYFDDSKYCDINDTWPL